MRRKKDNSRALLAYHEAGHAVLSAAINEVPSQVSIIGDAASLGRTSQRMLARPSVLAQVCLAGFAAEHLLTGRRPRQLDQEVRFSILARRDSELMKAFAGADQRDGHRAVQEVQRMMLPRSDDELSQAVNRLYDAARESLGCVWPAVGRVAAALLERESLDRDGVCDAIGDVDVLGAVFAIQDQRGLRG